MQKLDPKVKGNNTNEAEQHACIRLDIFTPRVVEILNAGCDAARDRYREELSMHFYDLCHDDTFQSPIEAMFYVAFECFHRICGLEDSYPLLAEGPFQLEHNGIVVEPQYKIGRYRADFVLFGQIRDNIINVSKDIKIAVELDGHNFHDKNEKQRRYEKKRDRYFQKEGFLVFRYTGSEIFKNPYKAACEVMSSLTGISEDELMSDFTCYCWDKQFGE